MKIYGLILILLTLTLHAEKALPEYSFVGANSDKTITIGVLNRQYVVGGTFGKDKRELFINYLLNDENNLRFGIGGSYVKTRDKLSQYYDGKFIPAATILYYATDTLDITIKYSDVLTIGFMWYWE